MLGAPASAASRKIARFLGDGRGSRNAAATGRRCDASAEPAIWKEACSMGR